MCICASSRDGRVEITVNLIALFSLLSFSALFHFLLFFSFLLFLPFYLFFVSTPWPQKRVSSNRFSQGILNSHLVAPPLHQSSQTQSVDTYRSFDAVVIKYLYLHIPESSTICFWRSSLNEIPGTYATSQTTLRKLASRSLYAITWGAYLTNMIVSYTSDPKMRGASPHEELCEWELFGPREWKPLMVGSENGSERQAYLVVVPQAKWSARRIYRTVYWWNGDSI